MMTEVDSKPPTKLFIFVYIIPRPVQPRAVDTSSRREAAYKYIYNIYLVQVSYMVYIAMIELYSSKIRKHRTLMTVRDDMTGGAF